MQNKSVIDDLGLLGYDDLSLVARISKKRSYFFFTGQDIPERNHLDNKTSRPAGPES